MSPFSGTLLKKKQQDPFEKMIVTIGAARLLALSFAVVILTGSFLLALPIASRGTPAPYLDHLFVATSAVCVTGLSPITVSDQYSLFGRVVMMILMELGGLGLMTFIAVLMSTRRNLSLTERQLAAAAAGTGHSGTVTSYVRSILRYTFTFEGIGAFLLALRLIPQRGWADGAFQAAFLSISAFTNSGFDCLGSSSLCDYAGDPLVSLTVAGLIMVGGLGFMVWLELTRRLARQRQEPTSTRSFFQSLSVHAKTVLCATAVLVSAGTLLFLLLEAGNPATIRDVSWPRKLLTAFFQSVTLRTAGFASVNIGSCTKTTQLIMCVFMLIGGSPGGTAGGIKTTTATVIVWMLVASLRGDAEHCHIHKRRITTDMFIRAILILMAYLLFLLISTSILLFTEDPRFTFLDLLYESVSAIATVGLTTGVTPFLSVSGKLVIIFLMFIGRVGPLAMIEIFQKQSSRKPAAHANYPDGDILIG